MHSSSLSEKKRKRERKKGRKKPRKCEYVRVHTTYTHRIGKKKREKGAVCSLARSSIVRDSFLRASAQAQMAMYVSRWDAGRSMEEKGGEGRGKRESERSKKHRERARKRTNDRVIWSLLSTVAVDHRQYIVLI